jgi:hypothetical protein
MTVQITNDSMTSDLTAHHAVWSRYAAADGHGAWLVSWLPGRLLDRNQAVTAMTLAEIVTDLARVGDPIQPGHRYWPHVEDWAAEVYMRPEDAVAAVMAPPAPLPDPTGEITAGLGAVRANVLRDVLAERVAQDHRWGRQDHPDGTGNADLRVAAEQARAACQRAAGDGSLTWRHILTEEVAEAFAEPDIEQVRSELIQVAAVAVAWIEAIDRTTASDTGGDSR